MGPPPLPPLPPGPPPMEKSAKAIAAAKKTFVPGSSIRVKQNDNSIVRMAAGKQWLDSTMAEWPANDYRIFVGNLGADVSDDTLFNHFNTRYKSVAMSKIIRDGKKDKKAKDMAFSVFSNRWIVPKPFGIKIKPGLV